MLSKHLQRIILELIGQRFYADQPFKWLLLSIPVVVYSDQQRLGNDCIYVFFNSGQRSQESLVSPVRSSAFAHAYLLRYLLSVLSCNFQLSYSGRSI